MPVIENFQSFMPHGLVCPSDKKKIEYSVADEPGLFVECRVSASAAPTWYLRLKNAQGTNTYRKLGTVKELSHPGPQAGQANQNRACGDREGGYCCPCRRIP